MVRGPFEPDPMGEHPTHRLREFGLGRIEKGDVVETRGIRRRRRAAAAFPRVQADVMMIAVSRQEDRLRAVTLRDFEADRPMIERRRPREVGDLQMDVTDAEPDGRFLG